MYEENGMRGIGGGNYFANSIDTRTSGVDVVASRSFKVGNFGMVALLAGYNHTRTRVTNVTPPPAEIARFESAWFNRTRQGIIERGQPRDAVTLTMSYGVGHWEFNLNNRRSGSTAQLDQANPDADIVAGAKWITDAGISRQLGDRVRLSLSAANLFDTYPDDFPDFRDGLDATGLSMKGIFRYPGALSPFGMNGRSLSVRLVVR